AANMSEMKVLSHEADSLAGELHKHVSDKKQQYTQLVRRILSEAQEGRSVRSQEIDLTVATYALFGMMNWIYNWYDPRGLLSVNELVENITRLFLSGFLAGMPGEKLQFNPKPSEAERLSVWRAPQV
ncbi:MAG TPA: hypothetical protein VF766_15820, partial [Pyrinomonadaceae bacterium]